ncbi:hypothetical protein Tco_0770576 [Tanacetum coccineum]|uniref:MAK10-like protein n=1 Tax=Tanacetum coccineum TaxID=301880 RepID=A0ABQ4ZFZ1_9ASTR
MEAHLAPKPSVQVNKITSSCEICSGPYDTQYCMEDPKQAFVDYASPRTDEAGVKWFTFKLEQNNLGDTYNPSWKSHPNFSSSLPLKLVNAIKTCFKQTNDFQNDQLQEPEKDLEDEFKDLNLKLLVLEALAHAPIYNAILDKYVESLELSKNGFVFIQGEMPKKIKDPGLFTLPCRLGDSNPFDTLADLGSL